MTQPLQDRSALRAVLLVCVLMCATAASAGGVRLRTLDGTASTLAELVQADRWTLVMMWTTYCGVCRAQYPEISAFHDRHKDKDATVIGISLDGYAEIDAVRRYVEKQPFSFPSVVGEPDIIGKAFEAATGEDFTGTPSYLLFNPARELVAAKSGVLSQEALERYIRRTP